MKNVCYCGIWVFLIPLVIMMFVSTSLSGPEGPERDLLFRHGFELGANPEYAAGDETPKFLGDEDLLNIGEGLHGKGFVTGINGQALRFKAEKNFSSESGTVMFWMSAFPDVKWQESDRKFYIFFELFGGGGWLRLYKYHLYSQVFLLSKVGQGDAEQAGQINLPNSAYREDQWNLFAFTWNANHRMSFYINGTLVGSSENFPLPKITDSSYFQLGQAWGGNDSENRVMDNVQIYDRALSNYEIMAKYRQEGSYAYQQTVSIGKTTNPPLIDGKIDEDEWQDATVIPLLIENAAVAKAGDTVSYLRMMYDEKDLFLAFHSPIPAAALADPHGKLLYGFFRRDVLKHDENVDYDDALDINIIKPVAKGPDFYRMVINTINTAYDYIIRADGTIELQWQPGWTVKSDVSEEGWTLEAQIPFAGLESTRPEAGESWQMNFHRIWKQLKNQTDSWNIGKRETENSQLHKYASGTVIFAGTEHVAVNKLNLTGLHKMLPELSMELINQGKKDRKLEIQLGSEKETLASQELSLAANEKKTFSWNGRLKELFPAEFSIRILDIENQVVLYQQQIPLWAERLVDVHLRSYPSSGLIKFEGDISALEVPAASVQAMVSIKQGEKTVLTQEWVPDNAFFEHEVDISALPEGKYDVLVSFHQCENELAQSELTWEKLPMPDWYGNQLGITNQVPAPWTALQLDAKAAKLSCWGREYLFGNKLFLTQITSGGQNLLPRAASINLQREGKNIDLNALNCQTTFTEQNESRIIWKSQLEFPDYNVTMESFLEFDGMLWFELSLEPKTEPLVLEALNFSIPLDAALTTLINPYDYSLIRTGYLQENGWTGEIRPLWLGNEEAGLQFFAETSHHWQVLKRQQELEVSREGDIVELKINLINKPSTLKTKTRYAFGLQATPVKPMHAEHRRWRIGHPAHIGELTPESKIEFIAAWSTSWADPSRSSGEVFYPNPKKNLTKNSFQGIVDQRHWFGFPYYQLHETWAESPEFRQFGDEWLKDVKNRYLPRSDVKVTDRQISVCQEARSHQDFILAGYEKLQQQCNPRGYYYDMSQPGGCNNVYHGCGYRDEYGQYHTTFNILGTRELLKRIYIHLKQHRPDGMILYHNSGQVALAAHGFADLLLDGENTYSLLDRKDNRGYEKFLTLDTFRAQYMGHNFGPAVGLLPQFTRAGSIRREEAAEMGPQHVEYVLGLILLHDSQLWIAYFYDNEPLIKMYTALEKHDFATGNYEFLPYWKQQITQEMPEKQAVASFYLDRQKKKALLVLMNMSDKEQEFALTLDSQALGFTPKKVENACHSEKAVMNAGVLHVSAVPSHTYRLFVLE